MKKLLLSVFACAMLAASVTAQAGLWSDAKDRFKAVNWPRIGFYTAAAYATAASTLLSGQAIDGFMDLSCDHADRNRSEIKDIKDNLKFRRYVSASVGAFKHAHCRVARGLGRLYLGVVCPSVLMATAAGSWYIAHDATKRNDRYGK